MEKHIIINNLGDEVEVDENGLIVPDNYILTEYKKINNVYIDEEYKCDDIFGVVKSEVSAKGKVSKLDVCGPISLKTIKENGSNNDTFYSFVFINQSRKIIEEMFTGAEVGTQKMIDRLKNKGLVIGNNQSFNSFINKLVKCNTIVKNLTIYNNVDTDFLNPQLSGVRYGFLQTEDGIDYNTFIYKEQLIKKYEGLDEPFGKTLGTKEEQIKMFEDVCNDFKNPLIFKFSLAASLTGIVNAFVKVDAPMVVFSGPSGCGKSLLKAVMNGLFGENGRSGIGLDRTGGDTPSRMAFNRDHFGPLPYIIDDLQPVINANVKEGISPSETIKELSYDTTQAGNGGRCNPDGSPRENVNIGNCPTIAFMEGNQTSTLTDGGSNRVIIIDAELPDNKKYVKDEILEKWRKVTLGNYGYIAPEFIKYLQKVYNEDRAKIYDDFVTYKDEAVKIFSDKIANNVALLIYTYDLMIDSGVCPKSWNKSDETYFTYLNKFNKFKSSTNEVLNAWKDDILKDSVSFPWYDKQLTEKDFEDAINRNHPIRGRKEIKDNKLYIYIPDKTLRQQLEYTAKVLGLTGYVYDINRLGAAGVLEQGSDPKRKYTFRMSNIERIHEEGKGQESVHKVVFDLDDEIIEEIKTDKEKFDEVYAEELKKVGDKCINMTKEQIAEHHIELN
jgi:hypothetical protein